MTPGPGVASAHRLAGRRSRCRAASMHFPGVITNPNGPLGDPGCPQLRCRPRRGRAAIPDSSSMTGTPSSRRVHLLGVTANPLVPGSPRWPATSPPTWKMRARTSGSLSATATQANCSRDSPTRVSPTRRPQAKAAQWNRAANLGQTGLKGQKEKDERAPAGMGQDRSHHASGPMPLPAENRTCDHRRRHESQIERGQRCHGVHGGGLPPRNDHCRPPSGRVGDERRAPPPTEVGIVWFRRELRLADNPALTEASPPRVDRGPLRWVSGSRPSGWCSRWQFLRACLNDLDRSLGG